MSDTLTGQLEKSAAQVYEDFFVPALFLDWTGPMSDRCRAARGDRALDVACGTGVLARELRRRVGENGAVVGLDRNDGMLEVARSVMPRIEWRLGRAEALPFDDRAFDAVASQFGLMFFEDRAAALSEMWRVLKIGRAMSVAVWDSLDNTPGYAAMVRLLDRLFGADAAASLATPYVLGDTAALERCFEQADIPDFEIETLEGTVRFPSIDQWVRTDIRGWTLADAIDDDQLAVLTREARKELRSFQAADGSVSFRSPAHIVSATRN